MNKSLNKIEIKNLSFRYNSQLVLKDVNIKIKEKEIITIIGPNGGGKTTLLKLILGLLQIQSGSILIDGKPTIKSQKILGYVPQHTHYDMKFPITVFDVVLSGTVKQFGYYSKDDKVKVENTLKEVGLFDHKNELFSNLSGGQKQRMLIARALVTDAEILFLDEPTSNIDPSAENNLNSIIKKLSKSKTIILVTHDLGFVSNITDRVLCINKTVVEHPIDDQFSKVVASSYSFESSLVRHDSCIYRNNNNGDTNNE